MFRTTIAARTSRNNWISLLFFIALSIFSAMYLSSDDGATALIVLVASVITCIALVYSIFRGSEWELVLDKVCVRWGNVAKVSSQKKIPIEAITVLKFTNYDDNAPFEFVTKTGISHGIPAFLLAEKNDENRLIKYVRDKHPKIELDLDRRKYFQPEHRPYRENAG